MIYDLIIIGAGASGLFAGANLPRPINGLVLEKTDKPGRKLLMSGAGQCNLTHDGDIKEFINHYGEKGKAIRPLLYQFNNQALMNYFKDKNLPLFIREDGKVFPRSLKAADVLDNLVFSCKNNGLTFKYNSEVTKISPMKDGYKVECKESYFTCRKLIISTGGCSYPSTGSDGSFFEILKSLNISIENLTPSLVPAFVKGYPYEKLSGISFQNVKLECFDSQSKKKASLEDSLLFTHKGFSGPVILNLSRYMKKTDVLKFNYLPHMKSGELDAILTNLFSGNKKNLVTSLSDLNLPKRFIETICERSNISIDINTSNISKVQRKALLKLLSEDSFIVDKTGGFESAMVTKGGVSIKEVNIKTMESVKYPGLYFIGEVVDIDGDTGGYNLQFAFSSAYAAVQNIY